MNERKPYFFLLGGYDLEMVEIKNLLENYGYLEGVDFSDKNLSQDTRSHHPLPTRSARSHPAGYRGKT